MKTLPQAEVARIPRTGADAGSFRYEAKVPYEATDDYGNVATMYRRTEVDPGRLRAERDHHAARVAELDALIAAVDSAA